MAGQADIAKLSLNFSTNIKDSDIESVDRLFTVLEKLDTLNIGENKIKGLETLGKSLKGFNGIKIGANLGKGIGSIVEMANQISEVKDISPFAETLNKNFEAVGKAAMHFNEVTAKIPINMGKGILGLVDATNQISNVKDISGVANRLNNNFYIIAQATGHFNELNRADYSGIARLISAMTSIGKIKPIGNTVIKNAEKLAKAVNTLTTNVTASTPRINAISRATSTLGARLNTTTKSAHRFHNTMTLVNLAVTIRALRTVISLFSKLVRGIYHTVEAWGEVENTLSFFSQALGEQAESTAKVIQGYSDLGVIDFSKFSNQVAKMTQIYKGYGIAGEDAAKMALNLTQLANDASYALGENGKDIDLWYQRITSVATGQTRAGYYFGVDTSVKALAEGFDELSNNADKATKSMASHEAMLKNTTAVQNQMAREINTTYVQMNIFKQRITQLKQSIGYALVPAFQAIIKWGLITIKVIELLIDAVVKFFGGEGFEIVDYSSFINNSAESAGGLADAAGDVADGFGSANKQAKELKKTISGIDQVFTINDVVNDSGGGTGAVGGGGIGAGGLSDYAWDFGDEALKNLDDINKKAEEIADNIQKAVPWVLAVATGLAAWKIAKSFLNNLQWLSTLNLSNVLSFSGLGFATGLITLMHDLEKFVGYFKDFLENGPTFDNVSGMLSSFVGSIGDILILFGNMTWGGALKVVQGLTDIVAGIKDMSENGINWENVSRTLDGIGSVAIGIGVIKQNWALVGTGLILQGALRIIEEIDAVKEAIATGDWSGVDKVSLFIGVVSVVGGVAITIADFVSKVKKGKTLSNLTEAPAVTETISTSTGGVSTKLVDLAKNIAAGALVIGAAVVAAVVFLIGVWAIGELLQEVGEAWGPVIEDGKNIAIAIGMGTLLLAGVGLAAWALGSLTISSGGTVAAAIGLGTLMLLALGEATKAFIEEIASVGDQLTKRLHPSLKGFNEILPDLNTNMRDYTKFMLEFAGHVAAQTASKAISGLGGVIDTIVGWFVKDPIQKMADDVKKNKEQFKKLNENLEETNPLIRKGSTYMDTYSQLLKQLSEKAKEASEIGMPSSIGLEFESFSKSLKDGFKDLAAIRTDNVSKIISALNSLDLTKFKNIGVNMAKALTDGLNNYQPSFAAFNNKVKTGLTQNTNTIGVTAARDYVSGINSHSVVVTTFTNSIKNKLSFSANYIGNYIATGVINGINAKYVNVTTFTNNVKNAMNKQFVVRSPSRWGIALGENIGQAVGSGINDTRVSFASFKDNVSNGLDGLINGVNLGMPTLDTGLLSANVSELSQGLSANVRGTFESQVDGTEQAVNRLTNVMTDRMERLITVTEDGKIIEVDGDKIGETSKKYAQQQAIKNNVVFGKR